MRTREIHKIRNKKMKDKRGNSRFETKRARSNLLVSKRSQLAIFIIVALLIVVVALIIFLLWRRPTSGTITQDPQSYIETCIQENAEQAINILSEQGGDINPELNINYMGGNYTYLCYNQGNYHSCINQRPMLIEHLQQEITDYVEPKVNQCFQNLKTELEDRGYEISMAGATINTELQTKRAIVSVKRKFVMTRGRETKEFENFQAKIATPLYELAEISMEIVNQEAEFCNFENLGFMIIYPEYDIRKINYEGNLIYTVTDLQTSHSFKFAVRTCVLPAGL